MSGGRETLVDGPSVLQTVQLGCIMPASCMRPQAVSGLNQVACQNGGDQGQRNSSSLCWDKCRRHEGIRGEAGRARGVRTIGDTLLVNGGTTVAAAVDLGELDEA